MMHFFVRSGGAAHQEKQIKFCGGSESTISQGQMGNMPSVNSVTTQTAAFSNPAFALNDVSLGPSITLSSPALPAAAPRQRWMFESAKSLKALL